jgi:hypothetical protein
MCPNEYDIAIQTDGPQGHQSADPLGQKATKPCWTDDPGATGFKERSLACSWILPVQGLDFSKRPADDSSGTRGTVASLWLELVSRALGRASALAEQQGQGRDEGSHRSGERGLANSQKDLFSRPIWTAPFGCQDIRHDHTVSGYRPALLGVSFTRCIRVVGLGLGLLQILTATCPAAAQQKTGPNTKPSKQEIARCIGQAAETHAVNREILTSIIAVESNFNPHAVNTQNKNGTIDIGATQTNSQHFKTLAKWGIEPGHLYDFCLSTFVGAWLYRSAIQKFGNTWFAVGAYHSVTPHFNARYQALIWNNLLSRGVVAGNQIPVASLTPDHRPQPTVRRQLVTSYAAGVDDESLAVDLGESARPMQPQ